MTAGMPRVILHGVQGQAAPPRSATEKLSTRQVRLFGLAKPHRADSAAFDATKCSRAAELRFEFAVRSGCSRNAAPAENVRCSGSDIWRAAEARLQWGEVTNDEIPNDERMPKSEGRMGRCQQRVRTP
jgi:hypothetical protein